MDAETEAMIAEALERAKREPETDQITATSVHFDSTLRLLLVMLSNGRRLAIPQEELQHLADASVEDAKEVTIEMFGMGLHWETLDLDFSVEGLTEGTRGNARWMKQLHEKWRSQAA